MMNNNYSKCKSFEERFYKVLVKGERLVHNTFTRPPQRDVAMHAIQAFDKWYRQNKHFNKNTNNA